MAAYREEEDLYEDDIVFDQAGLLNTSSKHNTAIRRVSSGKCGLFSKTLGLCGAFFGLGLCIAIPGPTILSPLMTLKSDESPVSSIYAARSSGYLVGSIIGGFLFDRFNRLFLLFISLLLTSVFIMVVPWCDAFWTLQSCMVVLGISMGFLDTGGNVLCLDLWGRNSGPFMQALHFSFGLGAFVAPLLAAPFLEPPLAPALTANTLSVYPAAVPADASVPKFLDGNATRRGKRDWPLYANGTDVTLLTIDVAPPSTLGTYQVSETIVPEVVASSSSVNSAYAANETAGADEPYLVAAEAVTVTPRVPKPKPSKTDGSKLGTENWDKFHVGKPPLADLIPLPTETPPTPQATSLQATTSTLDTPSFVDNVTVSSSDSSVPTYEPDVTVDDSRKVTDNDTVTTDVPDSTSDVYQHVNTSFNQIARTTSVELASVKESTDVSPLAVVEVDRSTVASGTESTLPGSISSSKSPMEVTSILQAPVFALENGGQEKNYTVVNLTSQSSYADDNASEERDGMPPLEASIATQTETVVLRVFQVPTHVHHFKPGTYDNDTEDINTIFNIFANRIEKYGLTKIQFTYLIVGIFVFIISLVFLGFLCHNPRDPKSKQEEGQGAKKVTNVNLNNTLILLMALFLMLYIGLEVTYGQMVVAFAVDSSLQLPPSTASLVGAVFWGTFAATRFASIFASSGLSPMSMLLVSFALCTAGTSALSALSDTSDTALWVGTVFISIGLAPIFPTSILWIERYIHVSNKVAAVFVIGVTLGEMICPIIIYRLMQRHPTMLMHAALVINLLSILTFSVLWKLASRLGEKYSVVDSNGYQLASQNEEEEDMMELSPSRRRISFRRHSFTSEHRSLLNGNLTRRP